MPRTKSISSIRHRKVKAAAKGFKQARRTRIKNAKESLLHAGKYAYMGRKLRKRDMKSLWITRISAASKEQELSYSKLMKGLKVANVELNRKMLSEIATKDKESFTKIVELAKKSFKS